ncbi:MAG: NAD(P)H-dependent oxidoreductase [Phycisphaerales bacterium]|nr:NAD(P)H-dependent oxidoreductase [Phycisphaerales bacterium]
MSTTPRILAFSGSLRSESWNHRLVALAAQAASDAGAEVTTLRLRDYPLPVYDHDLEEASGMPDEALALKELFRTHDGFLIASPEYNGSMTAALKNLIDWVSRPQDGYARLDAFNNKVAGLLSCSPGRLGGLKGLVHLRTVLSGIGTMVIPEQVAVPGIHEQLANSDVMIDDGLQASVERVGRRVAAVTAALANTH